MENRRILMNSISNEIIRYETMRFFEEKAKGFSEQDFLEALKEIPDVPPEDIDKIAAEKVTVGD